MCCPHTAESSSTGRGTIVFSHALNSERDIMEIRKERKSEKTLRLKEFASSKLYFERLANWMSNVRCTN
jgi:hypothetical protein